MKGDPISDPSKRMAADQASADALTRSEMDRARRVTFDGEYARIIDSVVPANGMRVIPKRVVFAVYQSMERFHRVINVRDPITIGIIVKPNERWVSIAYAAALAAIEAQELDS